MQPSFIFITIFYYGIINVFPLLLWPNKKNLYFLMLIPTTLTAYVAGSDYFLHKFLYNGFSKGTVSFFSLMLFISALVTLLSILSGYYAKSKIKFLFQKITILLRPNFKNLLHKHTNWLVVLTIILFTISYIGMGFLPAFAKNPMEAKFFAGEYQGMYKPFAIPFRIALLFSQLAILMLLLKLYRKINFFNLLCIISILALLLFSLRRGLIASQLVFFFLSYFLFKKRYLFWITFLVYILVFMMGSASIQILLYLAGKIREISLVHATIEGLPDIYDQLVFLDFWIHDKWPFTYGLSIFGGLIPYHFDYNVATLTKLVIGAGKTAPTGGFRLPPPLLGYIAFGWIGVIIFSIIHGYLLGVVLKVVKNILSHTRSLEEFVILSVICNLLYLLPQGVFNMQIDALVSLIFIYVFFGLTKTRFTLKSTHLPTPL